MVFLAEIFRWLNSQLLQMKWLAHLIESLVENVFGLPTDSRLGGSIHFFIYDTIKILILLSVLIFIISYIQSHFPPERTKKILGKFGGITGNIMGALLGTITPFCSCSSIPLFIGFTEAGLPLSITFSFLISSPMVDLASLLLLLSIFGAKIAIAYVFVGLILAIVGGTIIGKLGMEQYVEDYVWGIQSQEVELPEMTKRERINYALDQVKEIVHRVWLYILIGVGIGAAIHNWIPESIIENVIGSNNPFSVILATLVGVPMYADIFGTLPIAEALFDKGVGIGTVLSFMMAVTTLSLPSMIMLRKVVKPMLLWTFICIVTFEITLVGYLFNAFSFFLV
ncbi:permease [Bacillota bacterium LX-D]|nr:permease [Bacillota bacterium LX-D]